MTRKVDYTGQIFGRLTAIRPTGKKNHGRIVWEMKCECGETELRVPGRQAQDRSMPSCSGCRGLSIGRGNENRAISSYKRRAAKRKLEWRLSNEQAGVLFRSPCFYCGSPPNNVMNQFGAKGKFIYSGIDRIDNELDYVPFNVVPCCSACNHAKSTATFLEFISWISRISNKTGVRLGRA